MKITLEIDVEYIFDRKTMTNSFVAKYGWTTGGRAVGARLGQCPLPPLLDRLRFKCDSCGKSDRAVRAVEVRPEKVKRCGALPSVKRFELPAQSPRFGAFGVGFVRRRRGF